MSKPQNDDYPEREARNELTYCSCLEYHQIQLCCYVKEDVRSGECVFSDKGAEQTCDGFSPIFQMSVYYTAHFLEGENYTDGPAWRGTPMNIYIYIYKSQEIIILYCLHVCRDY